MAYGTDAPWGLRPYKTSNGALWNGQANVYPIASGYATSIFTNDPVYVTGTGNLIIAVAGAGNPIFGVFQGVRYYAANGTYTFSAYWPANTVIQANTTVEALVIDDDNVIYDVQSNNVTGVLAADIFNNADLAAGQGNTTTGLSGWTLDQTQIGNGATKQVKILALTPVTVLTPPGGRPGNVFGPFDNVLVSINNDYFKGGTGTVGV